MTSADQILASARSAGEKPPAAEASALFGAAMRLAVDQGHAPRPQELQIDDAGALKLVRDDSGPMPTAYLAPELSGDDPPRSSEPRVQVFAAGALGYELLAGRPPPAPPAAPGAEVPGLLGDLVKVALAADRRERFGDLRQMLDAVEGVQPRRSRETEQKLLAALVRRARDWASRAPPRTEDAGRAVRELSARVEALEAGLRSLRAQHDAALGKLAAAPSPSGTSKGMVFAIALSAALLAAFAADVVLLVARDGRAPSPRPAALRPSPERDAPSPPPADGALGTQAPAAPTPAAPTPAAPAPAVPDEDPAAALARAVARSQVERGEKALESGNATAAVASFRAALAGQPDLPEALRGLGRAHALQGKDEEARADYERYLAVAPAAADAAAVRKVIGELGAGPRKPGRKAR